MKTAIPDHELLGIIGRGAYGEVWLARNVMGVGRAVKIVRREEFADDRPYEREFAGIRSYEPLSRQAQGLVNVLHVGRNDAEGYFYYVMELADAAEPGDPLGEGGDQIYAPRSLRVVLKDCALPASEAAAIALSLANALDMLHGAGLVHRDIKPSNIIFVGGAAKLADIGLVIGQGESRSFVGTEGYIPPEGPGRPQADVFALGIVLYEMLTGYNCSRFPSVPEGFGTGSESAVELLEVVIRACDYDSASRYLSAREMVGDLSLVIGGKSVREFRRLGRRVRLMRIAIVVLGVVGLAMAGAWWWFCGERLSVLEITVAQGAGPMSFSPDGRFLVTADSRQVVRWSFRPNAPPLPVGRYPTKMTTSIIWMPDGKTMHTSGYQPSAEFDAHWTAIKPVRFPDPNVDSESRSADSESRIIVRQTNGARAGRASIFRADDLVRTHDVAIEKEFVVNLTSAMSPNGHWAAMGAFKGIGWTVWDTRSGKKMASGTDAATLRFSPDNKWLVVAGAEHNEIWQTHDWKRAQNWERKDLDAHFGNAAWSGDGRLLALLSGRNTVSILNTADWSERIALTVPEAGHIASMSFHPSLEILAIAGASGAVRLYKLR